MRCSADAFRPINVARILLLARMRPVTVVGVCRRLSSSATLHGVPAGGFTREGQAMTSCRLRSNHSSTVTLHGGPEVLRPVRATPCYTGRLRNLRHPPNFVQIGLAVAEIWPFVHFSFKMAVVRRLGLLKVWNFNRLYPSQDQCVSPYHISCRSVKPLHRYNCFPVF